MLSVPWFLGWALRPYIQLNPPSPTTPTTTAAAASDNSSSSSSRYKAKAQVAQLSSPSAARHVISVRTPSPTSPTQPTSGAESPKAGPYPISTQPITAKTGQQTRSAPPPSPRPLTKTKGSTTAAAPPSASADTSSSSQGGPATLVSTKTISLRMGAEWVQQQLEKFRFSFDEADRDKSGWLSLDEVVQVLTKHGFKGTKDQAKELFSQLDVNNDQKLTRQEFSAALDRLPRVTIKEFVLRKTFQQLDKDGSGKLSRTEIEDATKGEGGLDVPTEKIAQLLIVLSKDTKDDVVDYEEFLQVFGVQVTGDVMQEVFSKLDTDHSGYLSKQEILAAVHAEHELKLRAAKISDLLIAWHQDQDKKINYQEFVQVWTKYKN
ncbi:uncharacterized protein LOC143288394 [Babylonia areolata]|uniref:uncharacterized protein LOC143288394 n=1 Tax=Babylonia areolata TaxID=304850 RepID=UPI003FD68D53